MCVHIYIHIYIYISFVVTLASAVNQPATSQTLRLFSDYRLGQETLQYARKTFRVLLEDFRKNEDKITLSF